MSFKIPKKTSSDSERVEMTSPLSRLQDTREISQSFSSFRDRNLTNGSNRKIISPKTPAAFTNEWRPKRASDRFQSFSSKKPKCVGSSSDSAETGASLSRSSVSVRSQDFLAELRAERPDGKPDRKCSGGTPNMDKTSSVERASSDGAAVKTVWSELSDIREKQRQKWRQFKQTKQKLSSARLRPDQDRDQDQDQDHSQNHTRGLNHNVNQNLNQNRSKAMTFSKTFSKTTASTETIVLSSEEEEDQSDVTRSQSEHSKQTKAPPPLSLSVPAPSFFQLEFSSFHLGLSRAEADGPLLITESGINIPLTGSSPSSLCVVASQLRGFGLWDGGVARGGSLFPDSSSSCDPAPTLLFLWVSDSQSKLLWAELKEIEPQNKSPVCPLVLVVLKSQLSQLDSTLVSSLLDSGDFTQSRSGSGSGPGSGSGSGSGSGPGSGSGSLDWTQGLVLIHTCSSPVDSHLLQLLGHKQTCERSLRSGSHSLSSNRLIQYPVAPSKGRISVTTEDLLCLKPGEFLNDVIIDFYLKYLLLEGVGGAVAQNCHVFSSFFFKQLSKEGGGACVPDRHTRHQRVRTWTRNTDIFSKDFLFVPINRESHWFLVVVCFPGLEEEKYEEFKPNSGSTLSQTAPECTLRGCRKTRVLKRSCLLVMDSLRLGDHGNVCRLLRDYLSVEWQMRKGSRRVFSSESMKSLNCRVLQQNNSSDCGVYLLQNAQAFLQNPVVNFELPVRLETWFPRQQVRTKRDQIRDLVLSLSRDQT